jgi:hypothetical protein
MMNALPRWSIAGMVALVVCWQVSSCCCCLGGAVSPPVTPFPPSKDLAQEMRERVMLVKAREGPFRTEITDRELTSYIIGLLQSGAGEFPAKNMQIKFGDGYADIWATFVEVAPTDIPAYVRATIRAEDGYLVFYVVEANAGQYPVPGAMREAVSQSLSETLAELQLGLQIDDVQLQEGKMILSGRVTGPLPDLP